MIEPGHPDLSIRRQCELLGLNRATFYYRLAPESKFNLHLMRLIDEQYTKTPFYGWPKMTAHLRRKGYHVNHKRVQRLLGRIGLQAIYPKKRTTIRAKEHKVYPYLLRGVAVTRPDQVWCADITYIPLQHGFMYLVAILDWYSRYVLAWELSNTLDGQFCQLALEQALERGQPEIFNTDQGVQFTAQAFTSRLASAGIRISIPTQFVRYWVDGRGRVFDNIFVERLWRTVKYEDIYLKDYVTAPTLATGLGDYFSFYNFERLHQSLGYLVPAEVHCNYRTTLYPN